MEFRKMIEVMVAAVNALPSESEIADDLMEVATTCEAWIQGKQIGNNM